MTSQSHGGPAAITTFATAIYLIAALCIIAPLLDQVLSLPTIDLGSERWRFGAVGLLTGAAIVPLLGLLIALLTAVSCGHRWMHRIFISVGTIGMIAFTAAIGMFVLDAIQIRNVVAPSVQQRFDVTVIKSIVMQLVQIMTLLLLLRVSVRASRSSFKPATVPSPGLFTARARQPATGAD